MVRSTASNVRSLSGIDNSILFCSDVIPLRIGSIHILFHSYNSFMADVRIDVTNSLLIQTPVQTFEEQIRWISMSHWAGKPPKRDNDTIREIESTTNVKATQSPVGDFGDALVTLSLENLGLERG